MDAVYVFRVRFRLEPAGDLRVAPAEFETVLRVPAAEPGDDGWLFFRDNLWRGEVGDETHLGREAEEWLGVPVAGISFSELETDGAYLEALRAEVAEELGAFNADTVEEALTKYLGSSIRLTE